MAILNSRSNRAKRIIRNEISCYRSKSDLKGDAKELLRESGINTYYEAGLAMAQRGTFAAYHDQTDDMLGKIYGKRNVSKWSNDKKWNTYKHLIARETDSIIRSNRFRVGNRKK